MGSHRSQDGAGLAGRDDGQKLALVGDIERVEAVVCSPDLERAKLTFASSPATPPSELQTLDIDGRSVLGLTVPFPEDFDGRRQIAMLRSLDAENSSTPILLRRPVRWNLRVESWTNTSEIR